MNVLVIEDEKYGFENICRLLRKFEADVNIVGPVTNVTDMRRYMQRQQEFDIIFSDIQLEDGLSFDALADFPELTTPIIFVTAYNEFALHAFRMGGISYLLKPIDEIELKIAIHRALQMNRGNQNIDVLLQSYDIPSKTQYASRLLIKSYDGASVLPVSTINHIAFAAGKVVVFTNELTHFTLPERTLDAMFTKLNPTDFFRVNRQYIIRIDAINKIHLSFNQTEQIELKHYANLRIKVSKERTQELHSWVEHVR